MFVTLLDAMGHTYAWFSLTVFVCPFVSLFLSLRQGYNLELSDEKLQQFGIKHKSFDKVVKGIREVLKCSSVFAKTPEYYLTTLHFLTAVLSMAISQIEASTLNNPMLIAFFFSAWSAGVFSTFMLSSSMF